MPASFTKADSARRHFLLKLTASAGGIAALATAYPFLDSFMPSARARAAGAPVDADLTGMAPDELKTVAWRGKPVWILRRTAEMLAALATIEPQLADPASTKDDLPEALRNPGRSLRPEVFVAVGICTHLGCSPSGVPAGSTHPSVGADWPGGFFCPCHGSTFDLAGRVFKNKPAPTNLVIPPHRYLSETRLVIGEGDAA